VLKTNGEKKTRDGGKSARGCFSSGGRAKGQYGKGEPHRDRVGNPPLI